MWVLYVLMYIWKESPSLFNTVLSGEHDLRLWQADISKYEKIHLLGKGNVRHVVHLLWWMTGANAGLAMYGQLSANPVHVECCSTARSLITAPV